MPAPQDVARINIFPEQQTVTMNWPIFDPGGGTRFIHFPPNDPNAIGLTTEPMHTRAGIETASALVLAIGHK